jgi:phosphohistidine swiveling domain-containing protein
MGTNVNQKEQYFSGGLAEIVSSPSPLTYSFFKSWFTGNGSVGKAMELLDLPYTKTELPLLELIDQELVVNLKNEEESLYKNTIFSYNRRSDTHQTPVLHIDIYKLWRPACIVNTLKIVLTQSKWIAKPSTFVTLAQKFVDTIPEELTTPTYEGLTKELRDTIWPRVIAVGLLSEFYHQLLMKESKSLQSQVSMYMSQKVSEGDWFFHSISDQEKVRQGEITFPEYMRLYGLRADKDYELTCARWNEEEDMIRKRIKRASLRPTREKGIEEIPERVKPLVDASITLQLLRSEAKRKTLLYIHALRHVLIEKTKHSSHLSMLSKDEIEKNSFTPATREKKVIVDEKSSSKEHMFSGMGVSVSHGTISGIAHHVSHSEAIIPKGSIGIFENSSPEFAMQYGQCDGMIFLKGGQTSHGAIVAREFGIPAIIDHNVENIKDGTKIKINGSTGEWSIV